MNLTYSLKGTKLVKKLYIRLYHNKLDLLVSTGQMYMSEQWDSESQTVFGSPEINESLAKLKFDVLKGFNESFSKGQLIDKVWLEGVVKSSFSRPVSEVSLVSPVHTIYVSDFCEFWLNNHADKWKVSARSFMGSVLKSQYSKTADLLGEYERLTDNKWQLRTVSNEDLNSFVEWMEVENYQTSTIKRNVSRLKFFLTRSTELGFETSKAYTQRIYFGSENEELESVYLNETEIQKVFDLDLSHDEELDNVRDNLIISVWTALRVSDLMTNLKIENIKDGIISVKTKKTGAFVKLPVHTQVRSVLSKRFGMLPRKINASDYNVKVKIVCQLAGIDNLVYGSLWNPETKRKEKGYYYKWQLISSHKGRASFVSNLKGKVSDDVLMSAGGWRTDKMMAHYSKISKKEHANTLKEYWLKG